MIKKVRVLVLTGFGINCDMETAHAFNLAGAQADRVHLNDLIFRQKKLEDYHILALPGGFSFGDDIASGKILANKIRYNLQDDLSHFISEGKLIIGICNGFQAMVKMGLLPAINGNYREQESTLTFNDSGRFEDRWVYLAGNPESPCVFTRGIERLYLPVRHGEGKFIPRDADILKIIEKKQQIALHYCDPNYQTTMNYPFNPNGSVASIAGICDQSGRIFGLMPHPEAFSDLTNHPRWTRGESSTQILGLQIFSSAVHFAESNL